jgi:hypothetical protein
MDCKTALATMEARLTALEQQVAAVAVQPPPQAPMDRDFVKNLVAEVMEQCLPRMLASAREAAVEAVEMEGKKLNLVVIGLPESQEPNGDNKILGQFCEKLSVNNDDIVDTFRDGRTTGGRPRIMKVRFKNAHSRRSFLTRFREVRDAIPNAERAWIRPDLTYQQRLRDRELRDELHRRRDAGEANIKIRNGEIVSSN